MEMLFVRGDGVILVIKFLLYVVLIGMSNLIQDSFLGISAIENMSSDCRSRKFDFIASAVPVITISSLSNYITIFRDAITSLGANTDIIKLRDSVQRCKVQ